MLTLKVRQIGSRTLVSFFFRNFRNVSTSAPMCMQGATNPRPWLNIENRVEARNAEENNARAREDLAAAYRGMAYYGLSEGVCNHLSARTSARNGEEEVMLIIKYGLHWTEVTASSLLGMSLKDTGRVLEGEGEPEMSATQIHTAIHNVALRTNPSITSVFHSHPPHATALACLEDPQLVMTHQNSARFYNDLAYDKDYDGLVLDSQEGDRIAEQMKGKAVLFMGNHGVLVAGRSIAETFDKTYYLERAAQVQILAMSTGKKLSVLSDKAAESFKQDTESCDFLAPAHFNSIKRVISHVYPGDFTS